MVILNESVDQVLTVIEPDGTLAVELENFDARKKEKEVLLNWTTLSEVDNDKVFNQKK